MTTTLKAASRGPATYVQRLLDINQERRVSGGFPPGVETERNAELDALWRALSEQEKEEADQLLVPFVPPHLLDVLTELVDRSVLDGGPPRVRVMRYPPPSQEEIDRALNRTKEQTS